MTVLPLAHVQAAGAYAQAGAGQAPSFSGSASFGQALQGALQSAIDTGHNADAQADAAILGTGNLTDMVTALNRAELALQTTTSIRDRVVQAYQEIMRMPI